MIVSNKIKWKGGCKGQSNPYNYQSSRMKDEIIINQTAMAVNCNQKLKMFINHEDFLQNVEISKFNGERVNTTTIGCSVVKKIILFGTGANSKPIQLLKQLLLIHVKVRPNSRRSESTFQIWNKGGHTNMKTYT